MLSLAQIFLACTLVWMCHAASANFQGNSIELKNGEPEPRLVLLGRVGNKTFYVQRWTGNWTDSKEYCDQMNMRLGAIETEEERELLSSKYEYGLFWGWHWTAARDAHTPDQLLWHNRQNSINVNMSWLADYPDTLLPKQYLTCGAYIIEETFSGMAFQDCSKVNGHAICEQVHQ